MVYALNPLDDPRWTELVESHPSASVFHTREWVDALHRTYAYEPVVYTTSAPTASLMNGIPFCRVGNWLSGRGIVSLPFSDHCEPLVPPGDRSELLNGIRAVTHAERRYVELRPLASDSWVEGFQQGKSFRFHWLDLTPPIDVIFDRTHKSTIQRKIQRAKNERLSYESGTSDVLLKSFYGLLVTTRRRHGLPPQPIEWFRNLIECFGDRLVIRVAFKNGRPIGSVLTLQHRETIVYKYGCSEANYHSSGVMPFLFWNVIEYAKARGLKTLDLGRSDTDNQGLITFKERLGASASALFYYRYPRSRGWRLPERSMRLRKALVARMPDRVLAAAGRVLYRHFG